MNEQPVVVSRDTGRRFVRVVKAFLTSEVRWRARTLVALLIAFDSDSLVEHLIAAAAAGGFFLLAAIVYPAGMGMGDVKLAAVLGLFLGRAVAPAIFAALIAGTLIGGLVIARYGDGGVRLTEGAGLHQYQDGRWVQIKNADALIVVPPSLP